MPDPYYTDDHVTIYHGDCRDVLQDRGSGFQRDGVHLCPFSA